MIKNWTRICAFFVLLALLSGCSDYRDTEKSSYMVTGQALSHCSAADKCEETCLGFGSASCEGRWAYPSSSICYTKTLHPSCGHSIDPRWFIEGNGQTCTKTSPSYSQVEVLDCVDFVEDITTVTETSIEVTANLPADYMRYLYGAGGDEVVSKMEANLSNYCGSGIMVELDKLRNQCFPLATDIGEPDDFLTNMFEFLEIFFHIFEAAQTCKNPQGRDLMALMGDIAEKIPLDRDGEPHCVQTPSDMSISLRDFMVKDLQCPASTTDIMIDNLFEVFYGRVKDKLEDVVDSQCAPEQSKVYDTILQSISGVANHNIEDALNADLARQCEQECLEMLYYWSCDSRDMEEVCLPDGSLCQMQCPADESVSTKVIMKDAKCKTNVEESVVHQEQIDGAMAVGHCHITIEAPGEYTEVVTTSSCRSVHNGEDPKDSCKPDEVIREYLYSDMGLSRGKAESILLQNVSNPDPASMICLSGDDIAISQLNATKVPILHDRLMSLYGDGNHNSAMDAAFVGEPASVGQAMFRTWVKRLQLLGEFYGKDLPLNGTTYQERQLELEKFYSSIGLLLERYPQSAAQCQGHGMLPSIDGECGHFGEGRDATDNIDMVAVYGYDFGHFRLMRRPSDERLGLSQSTTTKQASTVGNLYDPMGADNKALVIDELPFGMMELQYLRAVSGPQSQRPLNSPRFLEMHISDIDLTNARAHDATVSIVYDLNSDGLENTLIDLDWHLEPELAVKVSSGSEVRTFGVATRDFPKGSVVSVPGPEYRHASGVQPWPYFVTIYPTNLPSRVEACERYMAEHSEMTMEGVPEHPMVSLCMRRLGMAAQGRDFEAGRCTDIITRRAISTPSRLVERDITSRQFINYEASGPSLEFSSEGDEHIASLLQDSSAWIEDLHQSVTLLVNDPYARPETHPLYEPREVNHQLLTGKLGVVKGAIHYGLGTHAPTPGSDVYAALHPRYGSLSLNEWQLLRMWRLDTAAHLLDLAHQTSGLSDTVFLHTVNDTLETIHNHMDMGLILHDSVCAVSPNCGYDYGAMVASTPKESTLSALWEMQRTLLDDNGPAVWDPYDSDSPLHGAHKFTQGAEHERMEKLFEVFDDGTGQSVRQRLINTIPGTPGELHARQFNLLASVEEIEVERLSGLMRTANTRRENFINNGTLANDGILVRTGLHHTNMLAQFNAMTNSLANISTKLEQQANTLIQEEQNNINIFDNAALQYDRQKRLSELMLEYDYLGEEINALTDVYEAPAQRHDDYLSQVVTLSSKTAFTDKFGKTYIPKPGATYITEISELDAKFDKITRLPGDDISALGVDWDSTGTPLTKLEVQQGELLHIDVSGRWAPDCALFMNKDMYARLTDHDFNILRPAMISSAGYAIARDNSSYSSKDAAESTTKSLSADICLEGGAGTPDAVFFASVRARLCAAITKQWTNSESAGVRATDSLNYATGFRVIDGVPFPSAPVGSLLLVGMDPQVNQRDESAIRTIDLVHPAGITVFAGEDLDYYLIVNDQNHNYAGGDQPTYIPQTVHYSSCQGRATQQEHLTINSRVSQPATTLMGAMANNMIEVLQEIAAHKDDIIATGSLSSTTLEAIRSDAFNRFYDAQNTGSTSYGGDYSTVPESLRALFESWIAVELDALQTELEIHLKVRRQDEVYRAIVKTFEEIFANGDQRSEYLVQIATHLEARRARHKIGEEVEILRKFIFEYFLPLVVVRGDATSALTRLDSDELDILLEHSMIMDPITIGEKLDDQFGAGSHFSIYMNTIGNASAPPPVNKWSVVSFPRPDLRDEYFNHLPDYLAARTAGDTAAMSTSLSSMQATGLSADENEEYVWVVDHRTDMVWQKLLNGIVDEELSLEFLPEDFYPGSNSRIASPVYRLGCQEIEAVVLDTVVLFKVDRTYASFAQFPEITYTHNYIGYRTSSAMGFPIQDRLVPVGFYDEYNSQWLNSSGYLGFIDDQNDLIGVQNDIEATKGLSTGLGTGIVRTLNINESDIFGSIFIDNPYPEPVACKKSSYDACLANGGYEFDCAQQAETTCTNMSICSAGTCVDMRAVTEIIVMTRFEADSIGPNISWLGNCAP